MHNPGSWARQWNIIDTSQPNPTIRGDRPPCTCSYYRMRRQPSCFKNITDNLECRNESVIFATDNFLERSDRKISAHATLETPPVRGNLTPLPEKPKKQPAAPPLPQQMVREASDLDVRRRNKGKVRKCKIQVFIL